MKNVLATGERACYVPSPKGCSAPARSDQRSVRLSLLEFACLATDKPAWCHLLVCVATVSMYAGSRVEWSELAF